MTNLTILKPRQALNKAYLKVKPNRSEIEKFKANLVSLLDQINESETEEFHKNIVSNFLNGTYYGASHYINTKGRNDLVIHNGKDAKTNVGVIIEAKKPGPGNKAEMARMDNLNTKAFQELLLYYLRERITHKNLEIKWLLITNIYEWFFFDAQLFEKLFAENKNLVQQFIDFEEGRMGGKTTDFFYKQVADPVIASIKTDITFTHFDIREYDKPLRNSDKTDDNKLIALYKLLSPEHLLKLPFANDSNSLDKPFYTELLHIIGLTETKEGAKKLIGRKKEGERNPGSLLENAIIQLDSLDKIGRIEKISQYGTTNAERLFNVALELSITWMNRILFLKLLESQLIAYHKGDKSYAFLHTGKVKSFDDLNSLFFRVLARKASDRSEDVKKLFEMVPYLNSSLFEPTELEHQAIFISQLQDVNKLPVIASTVLKINTKKRTGELNTLEYIFDFLAAHDFSSEGAEDIQEDNKTLINASVLGLIFEKINGYKDGSFFTPGFITMYMCRETIRRAVVQKFNDARQWNCKEFSELYDKIENRKEANDIINSLKICDPAVGSGHFLVSALNEMIAIKNDLKILQDRDGHRLKEYQVEVVNDELTVTDEEDKLFEYNPRNKESQRIQQTLFHEKQTIIENCLFGVDINPNSVKICRLRLWIELLKNAYYKTESNYTELETLPNIDINIKCGNSLISRFGLDADLKPALKKSKFTITAYRAAVETYRHAQSKEEKREMEHLIDIIKNDFQTDIGRESKQYKDLGKLEIKYFELYHGKLFDEKLNKQQIKKRDEMSLLIEQKKNEIADIKNNRIYENAFEWRFEFPEVLNNEGDYMGFDVVLGNPPYLTGSSFKEYNKFFNQAYITAEYQLDLYTMFIELSTKLIRENGYLSLITPNSWLKNLRMQKTRKFVLDNLNILSINPNISKVFEEAQVDTLIFISKKENVKSKIQILTFMANQVSLRHAIYPNDLYENEGLIFDVEANPEIRAIMKKVRNESVNLETLFEITRGVNPYDKYRGQSEEIIKAKAYHSDHKKDESFVPDLRGKHVGTFYYNWDNKHFISYGPWLAAPRDPKFFTGKRILFREILGERFVTTICSEEFVIDRSLYIGKPIDANMDTEFALGILASKLLIWLFKNEKNEFDDLFPKIRLEEFKKLPIPKASLYDSTVSKIISKILLNKQSDPSFNTALLEAELDATVYQLYGLNETEIKIVESVE